MNVGISHDALQINHIYISFYITANTFAAENYMKIATYPASTLQIHHQTYLGRYLQLKPATHAQ